MSCCKDGLFATRKVKVTFIYIYIYTLFFPALSLSLSKISLYVYLYMYIFFARSMRGLGVLSSEEMDALGWMHGMRLGAGGRASTCRWAG